MLTIRDDRVRELAREIMVLTGAPHMTAAIVHALEHEIERVRATTPLREQVAVLRDQARHRAVRPPEVFEDEERDALWER